MMMTRSSLCLLALLALPGSVVLAAVVSPRELPSLLRDAITTPAALVRNEAVLDVAEPGMVVGASCDSSNAGGESCWPVLPRTSIGRSISDGARHLSSKDSLSIIKYYGGAGVSDPHYKGLMSLSVLRVLYVIDDTSFMLACPIDGKLRIEQETLDVNKDGKLVVVPPAGCKMNELLLVFRRSGLQLLLAGAAQRMAAELSDEELATGMVRKADGGGLVCGCARCGACVGHADDANQHWRAAVL